MSQKSRTVFILDLLLKFAVLLINHVCVKILSREIKRIDKDSPDSIKLGGVGDVLRQQLEKVVKPITGQDIRVTNLGYIQRGGVTNQFDRVLGTKYGAYAVDMVTDHEFGRMVVIQNDRMDSVRIEEVVGSGATGQTSSGGARIVNPHGDLVNSARDIGITFGD